MVCVYIYMHGERGAVEIQAGTWKIRDVHGRNASESLSDAG